MAFYFTDTALINTINKNNQWNNTNKQHPIKYITDLFFAFVLFFRDCAPRKTPDLNPKKTGS